MSYDKTNSNEKDNIWDYSENESEEFMDEPLLESQTGNECPIECPKKYPQRIIKHHCDICDKSHENCDEFHCEVFIRNGEGDVNDRIKRKLFYIAYRTRQRMSGAVSGAIDGFATGMYVGGKWGGGGGWIMGGITQLLCIIMTPFIATPICFVLGFMSDRYTVMQLVKDYRYSIAAGGMPPTHGTLE